MLKIITSVFIVTRRLEKHSILKFICFKLLEHCNIFSLVFLYFMTSSVCWLLDRSYDVYISLAFVFLASTFWHTLSVLKSTSLAFLSRVTFSHSEGNSIVSSAVNRYTCCINAFGLKGFLS